MAQKEKPRRISSIIFLLCVLIIGTAAVIFRYDIYDHWRLFRYTPSDEVVALSNNTKMTGGAQELFYVYHPLIESKSAFNQHCTNSEKTIVLGCYIKQKGIYLYDITDERLDGIVEVTAAHEMLHAEYDRLSSSDRAKVSDMLEQAYSNLKNERIKKTIDEYKTAGVNTTNELHSILGTEVRDLPAELENYYKRYFTDRAAVISYSEKYEQEFTGRRNQVAAYDQQLDALKATINQKTADLDVFAKKVNADYDHMMSLKQSGQTNAYNAGVESYNNEVADYNANVKEAKDLTDQYNSIVEKRNALATEESQLQKAIDSRPATIPSE